MGQAKNLPLLVPILVLGFFVLRSQSRFLIPGTSRESTFVVFAFGTRYKVHIPSARNDHGVVSRDRARQGGMLLLDDGESRAVRSPGRIVLCGACRRWQGRPPIRPRRPEKKSREEKQDWALVRFNSVRAPTVGKRGGEIWRGSRADRRPSMRSKDIDLVVGSARVTTVRGRSDGICTRGKRAPASQEGVPGVESGLTAPLIESDQGLR